MTKTVMISQETHQKLREEYARTGKSIKAIIDLAVEQYLKNLSKEIKPNKVEAINLKEW